MNNLNTKPIKCKQCGKNYHDNEKCYYHPGTYTLFYKKKQLLNLDEVLKRKKTSELIKISSSLLSLKIKDRKKLIYEMKKKIMEKS